MWEKRTCQVLDVRKVGEKVGSFPSNWGQISIKAAKRGITGVFVTDRGPRTGD